VLDADIRSFYDTIDHGWLQRFLEHRIGDKRLVRLLMKWVKAGVMEDGKFREVREGSPQGAIISPLLSNIFLHYAFDLWVRQWRKRYAHGEMYIVRYADDLVMAFQREQDARAMRKALAERLARFGLELHPDKTRVLEFGRFAPRDRARRGLPRPETFEFLGFVHISGTSRHGLPSLWRWTSRKKMRAKLARLTEECQRRMHSPVAEQHAWLCQVLEGHYRYYGVPSNCWALSSFRECVRRIWYRTLQRRSQRGRWTAAHRDSFTARFPLPNTRIRHPWPRSRFRERHPLR
jgi:group II intron reverse transcriptase/maturase